MAETSTPVEVLCCYSHADEKWLHRLETHLSLLQRQGLISLWHDRRIVPGTEWAKAIDTHLETASVILLLVSADFLVSDYCYSVEMKRALERQKAGEACVVPILVRPVDWKDAPFAHLQALPTDAKPHASWRDEDRALANVATGIRRVIEDMPLLAASAPRAALPSIWNIPYPRNSFFIGREDLLSRLHTQLQAGQATVLSQPQAISGLGGIGKTQIAVEYAYRYHLDYRAVLWARAESQEALTSSFVAIAHLLNLTQTSERDQTIIVKAVKTWLQNHRQWLLILDNADELDLLPPFLPPAIGGHLLLTTRASAIGHLANRIEVGTLPQEMGALFLLRRARLLEPDADFAQACHGDQELSLQITREIGGLPLALEQTGAYLEATGNDLATYLQVYQQHRAELLRERRGPVHDYPESVATTWLLSFTRVGEKYPAANELLRLCAFLAPDAIAEEILTQGANHLGSVLAPIATDPFLLDQAIEALRSYSLMSRDPWMKTLTVHRLVQIVLRDFMPVEMQKQWMHRAVAAVRAAFPTEFDFAHWPALERLLPHALICADWITQEQMTSAEAAYLLGLAGFYLYHRVRYTEAESLLQQALTIYESRGGPLNTNKMISLNNLAMLYKDQWKYLEAELLFQSALAISELRFGFNHSYTAAILGNLADIYKIQGEYSKAEVLYVEDVNIMLLVSGNIPNTASSMNKLADLYILQGKYAEAESLLQQALIIYEQQLGAEHPDTADSLHILAVLREQEGKYLEAEPLYLRAVAIREQKLGAYHPKTTSSLYELAGLYRRRGKYAEAELSYQRALSNRQQALGPEHPDVASSLTGLATLYFDQGKYAEAEPLYQRALAIREQRLGPEDLLAVQSLYSLAIIYSKQGKYAEAEPLYQRVLAIREQRLGPEHPHVAYPLNGLANLYSEQGKYEQAEPLYQRALRIWEQQSGPEHLDVAVPLNNLAELYFDQGKYAEAEPLYQRALRIWEQQSGPEHLDVAVPLHGLANLYREQRRYAEAELFYRRAFTIYEQQLGLKHPETAEIMDNLAQFWEVRGNSEEARTWYVRALAVREQALGAHHPKTAQTRTRLIALLYALGQHEEAVCKCDYSMAAKFDNYLA